MSGKKTPDSVMSASRLPALLGLSRYQSANDELQTSIEALRGNKRPDITNEAMRWGDRLESMILREASERLQLSSLSTEFDTAFYHPSMPLACSLDGYADGRNQVIKSDPEAGIFVIGSDQITLDGMGVLEAKLTAVMPEEIPALYRGPVQLQAQMDIMEAKWGALCVLYQGTTMRVFLFEPHAQTLATIKAAVLEFQNKLEKFRANGEIDFYPPSSSKDADRIFPNAQDKTVDLPSKAAQLCDQILSSKQAMDDAERSRAEAEVELKAMLGDASRGVIGEFEVKWPMRSYKATTERIVAAKEAYIVRQSTLSIKERT
jgi:predicted phage-related endonuclease